MADIRVTTAGDTRVVTTTDTRVTTTTSGSSGQPTNYYAQQRAQ
jgi:hypothetical protein